MRRHRTCAATLLGAAALLLAPAPSPAQFAAGVPYYGGRPGYYGYAYSPYGVGGLSWDGAYSPTQRYYWYGYNWPYPGYYVGKYHAPPYYPSDKAPSAAGGSSSASGGGSSYSYGAAPGAPEANAVRVNVRLPEPDAEVWFEGRPTRQRGARREFVSPPLSPDKDYAYDVRARWTENGREVDRTRTVRVRAGGVATVDFTGRE